MNRSTFKKLSPIDGCGAGVCIVMTLIFYLGVMQPLLARRNETAAQEKELITRRTKAAVLNGDLAKAKTDLDTMHHSISGHPLVLQTQDHLNNRLAEIAGFCKECGLAIEDVKPGTAVSRNRYNAVPIRLSGRGSYRSCVRFMHTLHQRFIDVSIASFRLSGQADDKEAPMTAEFELRWFAEPGSVAATE